MQHHQMPSPNGPEVFFYRLHSKEKMCTESLYSENVDAQTETHMTMPRQKTFLETSLAFSSALPTTAFKKAQRSLKRRPGHSKTELVSSSVDPYEERHMAMPKRRSFLETSMEFMQSKRPFEINRTQSEATTASESTASSDEGDDSGSHWLQVEVYPLSPLESADNGVEVELIETDTSSSADDAMEEEDRELERIFFRRNFSLLQQLTRKRTL